MAGDPNFSARPFAFGSLIGQRTWGCHNYKDGIHLRSLFYEKFWDEGINIAECLVKPILKSSCVHTQHGIDIPMGHGTDCYVDGTCGLVDKNCACGFWAYTDSTAERYYESYAGSASDMYVTGIVEGFGKCVVGPKGFRAEKCIIRALVLPGKYSQRVWSQPNEDRETIDRRIINGLSICYPDLPILPNVETLLREYPLTDTDIPSDDGVDSTEEV